MSDLARAETIDEAIKQIHRIIVTAERDIKSCEGGITKQLVKSTAYEDIKAVLGLGAKASE